jgi:endogenous inhibitor of DNA gyrase (YacG/DUF329 family)
MLEIYRSASAPACEWQSLSINIGYKHQMSEKIKILKVRCPRCGTRTEWQGNPNRPFCSEKCRLVDLGRWASEEYRVPGEKVETEEEDQD